MTARPYQLVIYRSVTTYDAGTPDWRQVKGWRWRLVAPNGQNVGPASEQYQRRAGLDANLLTVLGLDVTRLKAGETQTYVREILAGPEGIAGSIAQGRRTRQTIRVSVTP